MIILPFFEGISIAIRTYQAISTGHRFYGLEEDISAILQHEAVTDQNIRELRESIDRLDRDRRQTIRAKINEMLAQYNLSNVQNINIVSDFLQSFSYHVLAVTFIGEIETSSDLFSDDESTLITSLMDTSKMVNFISRLGKLKGLRTVTIVTNTATSEKDVREIGYAVAFFLQLAKVFGFDNLCLTDHDSNTSQDGDVVISFEGAYSLAKYDNLFQSTRTANENYDIVPFRKKNVYIIGANGTGKSTWANYISNEPNRFQSAIAEHTTMIPTFVDVEDESDFCYRLWDTPGIFDGTVEAADMEEYMSTVIRLRQFFSAVVFIFPGTIPSNQRTNEVLKYAVEQFGADVKKSFIAIINTFEIEPNNDRAREISKTYANKMMKAGFHVSRNNFFVTGGDNEDVHFIQAKLKQFGYKFIARYKQLYIDLYERFGDSDGIIEQLRNHGLEAIKRFWTPTGFLSTTMVAINDHEGYFTSSKRGYPDILSFRQSEKRSLLRNLGIGSKLFSEQEKIKLHKSCMWPSLLEGTLPFGQKRIIHTVLSESKHVALIHAPSEDVQFLMIDSWFMKTEHLRHLIETLISWNVISDDSEWLRTGRRRQEGTVQTGRPRKLDLKTYYNCLKFIYRLQHFTSIENLI